MDAMGWVHTLVDLAILCLVFAFLRQDVFRCLCRYDGTFREAFGAFALEISQRCCSAFKR